MTAAEIISDLDDHGFGDTSEARKVHVINEAYWDVCAREPWPFLEKNATLTFDGTDPAAGDMPTDFHALTAVEVSSSNAGVIEFIRREEFLRRYVNSTDVGIPRYFYFMAGELRFFPVPSSSVEISLDYLATPAALAAASAESDILIPAKFHRGLLVNGALYRLYAMEDDLPLAQGFERYYEKTITYMRDWIWRRQYASQEIIHAVDPDDLGWEGVWG